ncbi:GTP cyclohydrolase 1 feedback regulatory protein [Lingula anatina]|uniref:GTP cyclohydrolase 1 feedback regulatory protein n=1 Tax=Lingula anatina TaxID=7574 RepID=A0A1S3JRX3_LINAN|nr:GTP cyclohydrolase 1 feedback regulatory protein [Lingula anatina]|eukprot:XP_013412749.1 GTP cyclohydrolase 1 feedback regulatory protein [Lingula anatina]
MPFVIISTQIRLEKGPTVVGDADSDPELMKFLGAELVQQLGNDFSQYEVSCSPRVVLNQLEKKGYKVLGMTGIGQTCIWTLHLPLEQSTQNDGDF